MEYRYGAAAAADPRSAWPNFSGGQGLYALESLSGNPSASLPLQYSQPPPKSALVPSYDLSIAEAHLNLAPKLTSHDISQHPFQGGLGSSIPRPNPVDPRLHDVSVYSSSQGVQGLTPSVYDISLNATQQGVPGSNLPRPNPPDARLSDASLYASQGIPGSALPRANAAHDTSLYAPQGIPGSNLPPPNPVGARLHDASLYSSSAPGVTGSNLPRTTPADPRLHDISLHSAHGVPGSILSQPNPTDPRLRDIAALHSAQGIPGSNLPVANGPDARRLNFRPEPVRDSVQISREIELRELEIRRRELDRKFLVERERAREYEYREALIQRDIVLERQLLARHVPQQVLQPKYNGTQRIPLNEVPRLPPPANNRVLAKKNPLPKASVNRGRVVRSGWCSICKIDCQTKYVLETHHIGGKKHKTKLQELAERSGKAKKGDESQQKQLEEKKPQTEQQQQSNATKTKGKEGTEPSNLGKRKQKVKGEGVVSAKKRQRVSDAIVVSTQSCEICNVVCSSQVVLESHLSGKKHAARLAKLQEGSKAGSEIKGDSDKNAKDDGKDTKNSEAVAVSGDEKMKSEKDVTALEVKDSGNDLSDTHVENGREDVNPEDNVKDANEEENEEEEEEEDGEEDAQKEEA